MALLKAFVCQVVLFGLYKLFLEQVVEEHLVPDELTRNCIVGFVCLLCFGIQLYTEKVEDQARHAEASKAKSRRRTPPDTAERVSEFLDERTVHMMRTLDAAMQQMNQMTMSDGYVPNVVFAAAGPEAAVIEQTFVKKPDVVLVEEIHMTKRSDVIIGNEKSASEPIVIPVKIEEVGEVKRDEKEEGEEVEEEESETKSDVCEEEEEDVVTVIDASKSKPEEVKTKPDATESEEEEEEEEEEEKEPVKDNKKSEKIEEKPAKEPSKKEEESEEEEEEEDEEEEDEEEVEVNKYAGKVTKKS